MCSVEDCDKPIFSVGRKLCAMHYARWQRHGSVHIVKRRYVRGTPEQRFHAHIKVEGACWIWQCALDKDGYGYLRADGKRRRAHCWAYEHFIGPIPEGKVLDHFVCDRPSCANPHHVRPVTSWENTLRAANNPPALNVAKTHCKRGHAFDESNTYIRPGGERQCRACHNARMRERNSTRR